jgi:phosphoribosylanthranilate isomerase
VCAASWVFHDVRAVVPDIKFCGLTRAEDAAYAAWLGAGYAGVIFAGGPRAISAERAADVLGAAGGDVQRVGVFASADIRTIAETVRVAMLDVIQLHCDPTAEDIEAVRWETDCQVWAVLRVSNGDLPPSAAELVDAADATLLDSGVRGRLGGTGVQIPWHDIAASLEQVRGERAIILAGGLNASNVRDAIAVLHPDVVDVSSGVESAPGIKDHGLMREFSEAAWR